MNTVTRRESLTASTVAFLSGAVFIVAAIAFGWAATDGAAPLDGIGIALVAIAVGGITSITAGVIASITAFKRLGVTRVGVVAAACFTVAVLGSLLVVPAVIALPLMWFLPLRMLGLIKPKTFNTVLITLVGVGAAITSIAAFINYSSERQYREINEATFQGYNGPLLAPKAEYLQGYELAAASLPTRYSPSEVSFLWRSANEQSFANTKDIHIEYVDGEVPVLDECQEKLFGTKELICVQGSTYKMYTDEGSAQVIGSDLTSDEELEILQNLQPVTKEQLRTLALTAKN